MKEKILALALANCGIEAELDTEPISVEINIPDEFLEAINGNDPNVSDFEEAGRQLIQSLIEQDQPYVCSKLISDIRLRIASLEFTEQDNELTFNGGVVTLEIGEIQEGVMEIMAHFTPKDEECGFIVTADCQINPAENE